MSAKEENKLTSSVEDYLEAIAVLRKKNDVARVRDIGRMLDVRGPIVTSTKRQL